MDGPKRSEAFEIPHRNMSSIFISMAELLALQTQYRLHSGTASQPSTRNSEARRYQEGLYWL